MPVTRAASVNRRAWVRPFWPVGRVHHEKGLVGSSGDQFCGSANHLVELFHEVGLGVETAGGIDDQNFGAAGFGGGTGVIECGRGIAALLGFDDGHAGAGGPHFELLDGCRAKGIRRAKQGGAALAGDEGGELAGGGRLAGAIHADHQDDLRRAGGVLEGGLDAVEDLLQFGFQQLLEFGTGGDARTVGTLAEALENEVGRGMAEIGGKQGGFKGRDGRFVDVAGERDDVGDLFGEGFAGTGDRLLHAIEEGATGGRFFGFRSGWWSLRRRRSTAAKERGAEIRGQLVDWRDQRL